MKTVVIGATGRIGSEMVRGLLARRRTVTALVRDTARARQMFGQAENLDIRKTDLGNPADVRAALGGSATVFIAMGSVGIEGNLQRAVIQAAAAARVTQFVRLSVLNASPGSLGINQRAHWNIDFAAQAAGIPYTTIRPAIFSASLLAAAAEIRESRTWTGLAGTGRVALVDHRDVAEAAVRVLTDPATWGPTTTSPARACWPGPRPCGCCRPNSASRSASRPPPSVSSCAG
jgi:NAD(P)H dehydrogenase (quinone)